MGLNQELGFRLDADGAVRLDPEARHEVAPGTIHFAVLTTMCEVAAAAAVEAPVVPATLTVNLLERAAPGRLVALSQRNWLRLV